MVIGRVGTFHKFLTEQGRLLSNQSRLAVDSTKLNTGKRILNNYQDPSSSAAITRLESAINMRDQNTRVKTKAKAELEYADSALDSITAILNKIKESAVQGASDTMGTFERTALGQEMRDLGETIFTIANSKIGNKHVFSGKQSDLKTIEHIPGAIFGVANYLEGQNDLGVRKVGGIETSISLEELFNTNASGATVTSDIATFGGGAGDIRLIINDGNGNEIDTGSFAIGGGAAATVAAINVAFDAATPLTAGDTIAQLNGAEIEINTSLYTSALDNSGASITILEGNVAGTALSGNGWFEGTTFGTSADLPRTLNSLESAYLGNNGEAIRDILIDLEVNLDRIIDARAQVGNLSDNFESSIAFDGDRKLDETIRKSNLEDIPLVEAISATNQSQAILNATMQAASSMMNTNVFSFVNVGR